MILSWALYGVALLVGVAIGLHLRGWMHVHRWEAVALKYRPDLGEEGLTLCKEKCADPTCLQRRLSAISGHWTPAELGDNVKVVTDTKALFDAGDDDDAGA